MADSIDIPTIPNTPILTRKQDNSVQNRNLPRGACNYSEKGNDGRKCGCRQYFDETFGRTGSGGSPWFCVCEHHACFHDQADFGAERSSAGRNSQSQSTRLGNDHEQRQHNLGPFFGYTDASPAPVGSQGYYRQSEIGTDLVFPALQHSLPDTLPWNPSTPPAQQGSRVLPPIPSSCLFPSQERIDRGNEQHMGCTQSSGSIISNQKRALADLRPNSFLPTQNIAPSPSNLTAPQSVAGSAQDQPIVTSDEIEAIATLEHDGDNFSPAEVLQRTSYSIRAIRRVVSNLSTVIKAHEKRLDSVENVSFSATDSSDVHGKLQERVEEIEDRFESVEIRQAEFDGRLIEIEKMRDNESSRGSVARRIGDNDSFMGSSFPSSVIKAESDSSLIATLKTQISDLQAELQAASPPTRDNPWTVEVVFLPFGSSLKGIWSTIEDFPSQISRGSSMATEDWVHSQLPTKVLVQTQQFKESRSGSWEGIVANQSRNAHDNDEAEFLVARSCNRNSKIYARLRSRGYVRTIQIMGPQAKDVDAALLNSFRDLPEILSGRDTNTQNRQSRLLNHYHALQSSWIPLRKLHKDSRLRFLDPSELISQTLWTVEFLKSSVVMRATGLPILFLTHPQGYTQHATTSEDHWTWPKIRLMPRVNLDSDESEVREGDANELCWMFDERFDERLDPRQSVHSSFASTHSLSIRQAPIDRARNPTSRSDHFSSAAASPLGTPTSSEHIATPIPESRNSRAKLRRTTSVPMLKIAPLQERSSLSKRKTSYYSEAYSKSSSQHSPMNLNQKRRRISRSPSRPRNTPRWSTGPYDYEEDAEVAVRSIRGNTPFCAYATPHSNDYAEYRAFDDEDEDDEGSTTQNADFDELMNEFESSFEPAQPEEVWEGVEDGSNDNADNVSNASDSSGAPSEYPSNRPMGYGKEGLFLLHVDEEEGLDASRKG